MKLALLFMVEEKAKRSHKVVITRPDFRYYDSKWMSDPHFPEGMTYEADVDIAEEVHVFDSYEKAVEFIADFYKNNRHLS